MIDIGKILKRAWHILWDYKVLWLFGILMALTSVGAGNGGSNYQFGGRRDGGQPFPPEMAQNPRLRELFQWFNQNVLPILRNPGEHMGAILGIGVGIIVLILLVGAVFSIVRYVSETAVVRMTDHYEQTGEKVGFKAGWKLGWDRRAFRLWLIDLIISLPAILLISLVFGLSVLYFVSIIRGNDVAAAGGVIAGIGCLFLFIFAFIVAMVFLRLLREFFGRKAILENATLSQSFQEGWAMFKRNWKSVALMGLAMLGIGIGFGIASIILFFVLIPVYLLLLIPALLVAAIPGLIAFGLASLFGNSTLAAIIGVLAGMPFFLTILFAPLTLLSGWYLLFDSMVWTLTYREIKAIEGLTAVADVSLPPSEAETPPATA